MENKYNMVSSILVNQYYHICILNTWTKFLPIFWRPVMIIYEFRMQWKQVCVANAFLVSVRTLFTMCSNFSFYLLKGFCGNIRIHGQVNMCNVECRINIYWYSWVHLFIIGYASVVWKVNKIYSRTCVIT